jgi:hypothetical protein
MGGGTRCTSPKFTTSGVSGAGGAPGNGTGAQGPIGLRDETPERAAYSEQANYNTGLIKTPKFGSFSFAPAS